MKKLSPHFAAALTYAASIHAGQEKFGVFPMIAHLMAVTALVLEHGGGETAAIAAMLHDAAEQAGGRERLADIREQFGDEVAGIVAGCTDAYEGEQKPDWPDLKRRYIAHIPATDTTTQLVSAADKLHNISALLRLHQADPAIWDRVKGGREGRLWYYRALLAAFRAAGPNPILPPLAAAVAALERALGTSEPANEAMVTDVPG